MGAILEGYHGDAARTFAVGDVSMAAKDLIFHTEESFNRGMEKAVEIVASLSIIQVIEAELNEVG